MLIFNRLVIVLSFAIGFSIRSAGQQNVLPAGGDINGAGGSLAFSIGQIDYIHFASGEENINLGVQQPYTIKVATNDPDLFPELVVFPNPVQNTLNIEIGNTMNAVGNKLSYQLCDINGKLITAQQINHPLTKLSMESLDSGLYLVYITSKQTRLKTFKIIKPN